MLRLLCVHPALCRDTVEKSSQLQALQPPKPVQHLKGMQKSLLTQSPSQSPSQPQSQTQKESQSQPQKEPLSIEACLAVPEEKGSKKVAAIERVIEAVLSGTDELLLLISTYTQIMDFLGRMCDRHNWGYFRLDGSTEVSQRQSLVNSFNARLTPKRLFLLSARAGGVGLNITGASRVVMVEPAWNPAIDSQSIARSWRFGQTRPVFVYRFFLSGSIEEVMLQRQLLKKDIADVAVDHSAVGEGKLDRDEMREVFSLKRVPCQTYELMRKKSAVEDAVWRPYEGVESVGEDEVLKEVVEKSGRGSER
ncbi:hypothetical protein BLSTO_03947 [Blastocystis sp. subtype 1]